MFRYYLLIVPCKSLCTILLAVLLDGSFAQAEVSGDLSHGGLLPLRFDLLSDRELQWPASVSHYPALH
jgi:hypothetical protein